VDENTSDGTCQIEEEEKKVNFGRTIRALAMRVFGAAAHALSYANQLVNDLSFRNPLSGKPINNSNATAGRKLDKATVPVEARVAYELKFRTDLHRAA
jgi:hypothetical protein